METLIILRDERGCAVNMCFTNDYDNAKRLISIRDIDNDEQVMITEAHMVAWIRTMILEVLTAKKMKGII
jgi:hypothetical protein